MKTIWDANKGDRFCVYTKDGELLRGVQTVNLETGVYEQYYIYPTSMESSQKKNVETARRTCIAQGLKVIPLDFPNRGAFIAHLIQKYNWTSGAEIGVAQGITTFHLLKSCPKLNMIAVDYWPTPYTNRGTLFRRRMVAFKERIRLIQANSIEGAKQVKDESLDFVFTDSSFTEESSREDIQAWLPKLKPDGMLIGHEFDYTGVRIAVLSELKNVEVWPVDNVWFTWKKDNV